MLTQVIFNRIASLAEQGSDSDVITLTAADCRALLDALNVSEMALCEIDRLWLREGQLYRFTARPDCAPCAEYRANG